MLDWRTDNLNQSNQGQLQNPVVLKFCLIFSRNQPSKKLIRLERPGVKTWDLLARSWKLFYELTNESLSAAESLLRRAVRSVNPSIAEPGNEAIFSH